MSVSIKQPQLSVVNQNFNWKDCDKCRLILCRYKNTGLAHTVMRVGNDHYVSIGRSYNDTNAEVKIECIHNPGWMEAHVEFIRYYDDCDQLVLVGS